MKGRHGGSTLWESCSRINKITDPPGLTGLFSVTVGAIVDTIIDKLQDVQNAVNHGHTRHSKETNECQQVETRTSPLSPYRAHTGGVAAASPSSIIQVSSFRSLRNTSDNVAHARKGTAGHHIREYRCDCPETKRVDMLSAVYDILMACYAFRSLVTWNVGHQ